jgi:hypothetical protein
VIVLLELLRASERVAAARVRPVSRKRDLVTDVEKDREGERG